MATCNNLEEIILAVNELSSALYQLGYTGRAKCILSEDRNKTAGQNAIAFVEQYADVTGSALRMIAVTTEIVADAIINDEAEIVEKGRGVIVPASEALAWIKK